MSHRKPAAIAIIAALCLARAEPAPAAGDYDPDVEFLTLTTPHFYVVHAKGYEHIALRAGHIAESLLPYMSQRYGYTPSGRTTIVIDDQTDFANGFATILPSKIISAYVTAPTEISGLEDYDDWLQTVINHELAHIFHLDMVFGLPWLGRLLFGKYVAMNLYTSEWSTEGLAVYEETVSSGSGRGRSSYVDMVLRTAALSGRFPPVDRAFRGYSNWPFSNVAYFIGGRFQLWLMERYGEEALLHYHRAYASTPIPYLTFLSAQIAFGATIEGLWDAFEDEVTEDAKLALELVRSSSMGQSEPKRLTRYGGDLSGPQITPDGRWIFFSTASPVDGSRVRKIPIGGGDDEVLLNDTFSKALSFTPDGNAFYFQQTEINQRFYTHNSVLRYDVERGSFTRVRVLEEDHKEFLAPSGSLRARDPDVSADKKRLVFVQTPYGSNRLVLAWLESDGITIHPKVIVPAEPDVQLSNPRFSPDGEKIAVSRFKGGRRDIVLFNLKGEVIREVTRDRAQDIEPAWSPDGRFILFASDRTGIYNLYAYDVEGDSLVQLTNLITGAYQPCVSPDMKTIVFRGYSADGFDVYSLPFEPAKGKRVPLARMPSTVRDGSERRWPPLRADLPGVPPAAPFKDTPVPKELPDGWSFDDYSAFDTILPFKDNWNLLPLIAANEREIYGQVSHFGQDALQQHTYSLWLTYGTASNFVGGGASYRNDQLEPSFTIAGGTDARGFTFRTTSGGVLDYFERRLIGSFGIDVPVHQRHRISLAYIIEDRAPLDSSAPELLEPGVRGLPPSGRFARVQLGYSYSNLRSFAHSVSLERGVSAAIALEGLSKGLGSDYEQIVASGEARWYLSLPWRPEILKNHVLASRLALSLAGGPDLAERFRMGGATGRSILTTTTQNFYPLRGLLTSGLEGPALINGTIEYRAPIVRVERGLWTLPLVMRVFHLAAFVDFGRTFESLDLDELKVRPFDPVAVGGGGELRADVLVGELGVTLRLGYAWALKLPDQGLDGTGVYFQLGSTY